MTTANSSSLSIPGLIADKLCTMFYCIDPRLHLHEKAEDVPDYVGGAVPMFIALILLEAIAIIAMGRRQHLLNLKESLCSISLGLMQLAVEGAGFTHMLKSMYPWAYDNLRVCTVPHDSALCWVALFLGVDLCYYWMHRCSHELHCGWVGHSVHHSGEYYNLATALRQVESRAAAGQSPASRARVFIGCPTSLGRAFGPRKVAPTALSSVVFRTHAGNPTLGRRVAFLLEAFRWAILSCGLCHAPSLEPNVSRCFPSVAQNHVERLG